MMLIATERKLIQQDEHQHREGRQGGEHRHGRRHLGAGGSERASAGERGQGADHHLLGDQASEQSHRRLPQKPKPRGLKMGAMTLPRAPSMLSASFSTICRGEVKGLEQPEQDAHQQDQGARLDEEALHLLPHMGEHVVQGGQAVRGQLQHKGGGLPGKEGMLEQQAGQDARRHAA